jgi:hypothetical protein
VYSSTKNYLQLRVLRPGRAVYSVCGVFKLKSYRKPMALTISPSGSGLYTFQINAATIYTIAKYPSHALIRTETLQGKCDLSCRVMLCARF